MNNFLFEPLRYDHVTLVHKWLQNPHVMEFWDDGDRSIEDVQKHYFHQSDVKSWISNLNGIPFAYIQIYQVDEHQEFSPWKSKKNPTFGLDFFIGESTFLNKGFAAVLLEHFIADILKPYLPYRLLVDPEERNLKAVHIYHKIDFQMIGKFQKNGKSYKILKKDLGD